MLDTTPDGSSHLSATERVGCYIGEKLAETRLGRAVATRYQTRVVVPTLGTTIDNRLHVTGREHMPKHRSFIFAANHRSYFDLYAVLIATWHHFDRPPHLYCPVRTKFFYERPGGVLFNLLISGNAMYPPVFRDQRGPALNALAVGRAVRLLERSPRTVLAIHPEGRRNKSDDLYSYLPPKPGIGRIALPARCPVIPVYVAGLPASFGALVRDRLSPDGTPVRVRMGAPIPLADLHDHPEDPGAHHEAARRTMEGIATAGEGDRAFMAAR